MTYSKKPQTEFWISYFNEFGWYIIELNSIFLGIGLLAAIIGRLSAVNTSVAFLNGAKGMLLVKS